MQISVASDANEAIRATSNELFSIIIMDIELPGMSGVELTRWIRDESNGNPNIKTPIVAMTAYVSKELEEKCLDAGMTAFLPKPIHKKQLKDVFDSIFRETGLTDLLTEADDGALLDRATAIEIMGGDENVYHVLWDLFAADAPGYLEQVETALTASDQKTARRYTHQLKGLCKTMGAFSSSAQCGHLLDLIKEGKLDEALIRFNIFENELKMALKSGQKQ